MKNQMQRFRLAELCGVVLIIYAIFGSWFHKIEWYQFPVAIGASIVLLLARRLKEAIVGVNSNRFTFHGDSLDVDRVVESLMAQRNTAIEQISRIECDRLGFVSRLLKECNFAQAVSELEKLPSEDPVVAEMLCWCMLASGSPEYLCRLDKLVSQTRKPILYSQVGYRYYTYGDIGRAIQVSELGLQLAIRVGRGKSEFFLKHNLSFYYASLADVSNHEKAFEYIQHCLCYIQKEKTLSLFEKAACYDTAGYVYLTCKRNEKDDTLGMSYFCKALELEPNLIRFSPHAQKAISMIQAGFSSSQSNPEQAYIVDLPKTSSEHTTQRNIDSNTQLR